MLSVGQLKKLCFDLRISPSKKRGQNFLINEQPLHNMIKAAALSPQDTVIEIGPGFGVLTEQILKTQPQQLTALEIEPQLAAYLTEKFSAASALTVVNTDALQWLPSNHPSTPWKLVANIPYHITGAVIQTALELKNPPERMVLMMQKEVGEKLIAQSPHMSAQAVLVQRRAMVHTVARVPKQHFWPAPEVDSVVVQFNLSKDAPPSQRFTQLVKAGFSHPRKLLASNISDYLNVDRIAIEQKLQECGLKPTARAQELTVEQWDHLCTFLGFGIL